jgi:hypothetical protein
MKTVVIMPGGFHPFHAGHYALYQQAQKAFPGAEVFVAATDDRSTRPFPFEVKEKLARLAGVDPSHFVRVTSPFQAREITANFDPNQDRVIFVRSEKDVNEPPRPGGVKKDGSPSYLQPYTGKDMEPFGRHAYMAYLPVVEFGSGMTSATQIRTAWPNYSDKEKIDLVHNLYPRTQTNSKLTNNVVKILDTVILGVAESTVRPMFTDPNQMVDVVYSPRRLGQAEKTVPVATIPYRNLDRLLELLKTKHNIDAHDVSWSPTRPVDENPDYIEEKWSAKYKRSINCAHPRGFSQRAHCQGRRKK